MMKIKNKKILGGFVFYLLSMFLFSSLNAQDLATQKQMIKMGEIPTGVSARNWRSIQSQIKAGQFKASQNKQGYATSNMAHGWDIQYGNDGKTTLTPLNKKAKNYHIGMKLSGIGYQKLQTLDKPQQITTKDTTVTYQWNKHLREWWVNSNNQLEQWFKLEQKLKGAVKGQRLKIQMVLNTDLDISLSNNNLKLSNENGTNITYNKLKVWDAKGQILAANMALSGKTLSLLIDDSQAVYPLTIDPAFQQQAYIKPSDTRVGGEFGSSVAISGNTMVVASGFVSEFDDLNNIIDIYVFVRDGSTWSEQAHWTLEDSRFYYFGKTIDISGDTVVVSAGYQTEEVGEPKKAENNTTLAYIYTRNGTEWSQQVSLSVPNEGSVRNYGGGAVAIFENTVAIRSWQESLTQSTDAQNITYVFERSGTNWSQQAQLIHTYDKRYYEEYYLGGVDIYKNTVIIGSSFENSDNNSSVHVFVRNGTQWSQQAKLINPNPINNEEYSVGHFGWSVAIDHETVVIGSPLDNHDEEDSQIGFGAVYVYTRNGTSWTQQAYLKALNPDGSSDSREGDYFGWSVAISGETIIVGAPIESSNATGIDGDQTDNSAYGAGAAYVFDRKGTQWNQQAYLKASNTGGNAIHDEFQLEGDIFGLSVAISDNTIAVGAPWEDSNATGINGDQNNNEVIDSGAVYVFISHTVGGTVTGLAGSGLVLQNNAGDDLAVTGNGEFTFAASLADDTDYAVTVLNQPTNPNQTCVVTNGSGTVIDSDIADISISCATDSYAIGGTITGLAEGNSVVLQNNVGNDLTINADGNFTFATELLDTSDYKVTVLTQPSSPKQTCIVDDGEGALAGDVITTISISCTTNTYSINGTVSGLATGNSVVLQNNGGDDLRISADGVFAFPIALTDASSYVVSILSQPSSPAQTCNISPAGGTLAGENVNNIIVNCSTNTYLVGGSVVGLSGSGLVLQNNAGDNLNIDENGEFSFANALGDGSSFTVTVLTQPQNPNQSCSIAQGSGTLVGENKTNVSISCATNIYTIGGSVIGLTGTGLVLQNNSGDDVSIDADGNFNFPAALVDGSDYKVTISKQAINPDQICSVANGTGRLNGASLSNITITCVLNLPELSVVSLDGATAYEKDSLPSAFTISRTGSLGLPLTVHFTLTGSATMGDDYENVTSPVVIPAGASSVTIDIIPIDDADTTEEDETVILNLVDPEGSEPENRVARKSANSSNLVALAKVSPPASITIINNANIVAVPTLHQWALILLILSLMMVSWSYSPRQLIKKQ